MPSIPAIQQKVLKDKIVNDITEDYDFSKIFGLIKQGSTDIIQHPGLYTIFFMMMIFRYFRLEVSLRFIGNMIDSYPILWARTHVLSTTTLLLFFFCMVYLPEEWNWREYIPDWMWAEFWIWS
jgi:hypothetical protein